MYDTNITLVFYSIFVVVSYSHEVDVKERVFDQKTQSPVRNASARHISITELGSVAG
jgi:hypothetical protein